MTTSTSTNTSTTNTPLVLTSDTSLPLFYTVTEPTSIEVKSGSFTIEGEDTQTTTSSNIVTIDAGATANILPSTDTSQKYANAYIDGNGGNLEGTLIYDSYDPTTGTSTAEPGSSGYVNSFYLDGNYENISLSASSSASQPEAITTNSDGNGVTFTGNLTLENINVSLSYNSTTNKYLSFTSTGDGNLTLTNVMSQDSILGTYNNISLIDVANNILNPITISASNGKYVDPSNSISYSGDATVSYNNTLYPNNSQTSRNLFLNSTGTDTTTSISNTYDSALFGTINNLNMTSSFSMYSFADTKDVHITDSHSVYLTSDFTNLWISNSYSIDNITVDADAKSGVSFSSVGLAVTSSTYTLSDSTGQTIDMTNGSSGIDLITGNYGNLSIDSTSKASNISGNFDNIFTYSSQIQTINVGISGYGDIENANSASIYGNDASVTLSSDSTTTINGTFKSLVLNNDTSDTAYVSVSDSAYINEQSSNINLTATTKNSNIDIYGDDTNTYSILGNDAGTITDYTTADTRIVGNWQNFNGVVSKGTDVNISTVNANIYNNTTSITSSTTNSSITALSITGTSDTGTLTYNGDGNATIVGEWGDVTATFGTGVDFNSIIGSDSSITLNTGVTSSIWNKSGTDVDINVNGGINNITMGSGYTGLFVDMSTAISTTVSNFSNTHGEIVLSGVTQSDLSIAYNSGNAVITDTKSETTLTIAGATDITSKLSTDTSGNSTLLLSNNS